MSSKTAESVAQRYLRPKRAMVGNSFGPFKLTISRAGPNRYVLKISASGSIQGGIQDCSDILRFVSNDIHEMSGIFFTLGLMPYRHRLVSKSAPLFTSGDQITCTCTVDFELDADDPKKVFEEAQRPLGITEMKIDF